jgi:hypothetical protein
MANKRKKMPMSQKRYVERVRLYGYRRKVFVGIMSVLLLANTLLTATPTADVQMPVPVAAEEEKIVLIDGGLIWVMEN